MCNNLAIVSQAKDFEKLAAQTKLALVLGKNRGVGGTGIMHNGERTRSHSYKYKGAVPATHDALKFISEQEDFELTKKRGQKVQFIMGHNRKPSSGGYKDEFVHPFYYFNEVDGKHEDRMFFQHNGTITNIHEICEQYGLKFSEFGNDSMVLGHLIHIGVDPAELFTKYEGGCTCIWYRDGEMNIFKGSTIDVNGVPYEERPLYALHTKDTIFYNSQKEIIDIITGGKYSDNIYQVKCNTILTIGKDMRIAERKVDRKVADPPPVKQKAAKPVPFRQRNNSYTGKYNIQGLKKSAKLLDLRANCFQQMVWYDGLYYFSGLLAHGYYILDVFGNIKSVKDLDDRVSAASESWFYEGHYVKNEDAFNKCVDNSVIYGTDFHHIALHRVSCPTKNNPNRTEWKHYGKRPFNLMIKHPFCYPKQIEIANHRIVDATMKRASAERFCATKSPVTNDTQMIENYNEITGKDFLHAKDVVAHYQQVFCNSNHELADNIQVRLDLENMMGGSNSPMFDNKYVELYNELNETNLFTIAQCMLHFHQYSSYFSRNSHVKEFYYALDNPEVLVLEDKKIIIK